MTIQVKLKSYVSLKVLNMFVFNFFYAQLSSVLEKTFKRQNKQFDQPMATSTSLVEPVATKTEPEVKLSKQGCIVSITTVINQLDEAQHTNELKAFTQLLLLELGCSEDNRKQFITTLIKLCKNVLSIESLNNLKHKCDYFADKHSLSIDPNTIKKLHFNNNNNKIHINPESNPSTPRALAPTTPNSAVTKLTHLSDNSINEISKFVNKSDSLTVGHVNKQLYIISQSTFYLLNRNDGRFSISPRLLLQSMHRDANTFSFSMMPNIEFALDQKSCIDRDLEFTNPINKPFPIHNKSFINSLLHSSSLESVHFKNLDAMTKIPLAKLFEIDTTASSASTTQKTSEKNKFCRTVLPKLSISSQYFRKPSVWAGLMVRYQCTDDEIDRVIIPYFSQYKPLMQETDKNNNNNNNKNKVCIDTLELNVEYDVMFGQRPKCLKPLNVHVKNLSVCSDVAIKTRKDLDTLFHPNLHSLAVSRPYVRYHQHSVERHHTGSYIYFDLEDTDPQVESVDCPHFKTLELSVGSPVSKVVSAGQVLVAPRTTCEVVDDHQQPDLQNMFDNFHKYQITRNIEILTVWMDNSDVSLQKYEISMDCIIKHNSLYFPELKKLIFKPHSDTLHPMMEKYLKANKKLVASETNIEEILIETMGYNVTVYKASAEQSVSAHTSPLGLFFADEDIPGGFSTDIDDDGNITDIGTDDSYDE